MEKNILVIGCSDKKTDTGTTAYELYQGCIYELINSNLSAHGLNIRDLFSVYIVSAKHGLLHMDDFASPYNLKMASRKKKGAAAKYAKKHGASIRRTLRKAAGSNKDKKLFVCLTNDYLAAMDSVMGDWNKNLLNQFSSHYIARGMRGIGDLRGAVKRVLMAEIERRPVNAVFHRSGISNAPELGYADAGEAIGCSLGYTNSTKNPNMYSTLLSAAETNHCFYDNGLIQAHKAGVAIDTTAVFAEYEKMVALLSEQARKNLSIVIPDDTQCNDSAVAILRKHRKVIRKLATLTNVILPVHKAPRIRTHALNLLEVLGSDCNVRLGVPCLSKGDKDFMLSLADIDALLTLKRNPKDKETAFKSVHFFALGDSSHQSKLAPRLELARLHGVECFADVCRTPALFGSSSSDTLRQGTKAMIEITKSHEQKQVANCDAYKAHDFNLEEHYDATAGIITDQYYELLTVDTIWDFVEMHNAIFKGNYAMTLNLEEGVDDEFEAEQRAWDLVSTGTARVMIFDALKSLNWEHFKKYATNLESMPAPEARYQAILSLFKGDHTPSGSLSYKEQLDLRNKSTSLSEQQENKDLSFKERLAIRQQNLAIITQLKKVA